MEHITAILAFIGTTAKAATDSYVLALTIVTYLRNKARKEKTTKALKFLRDLGCASDAEVKALVERWEAPHGFTAEQRGELVVLLTNLVRGARFHSTQGTPLSSYLRCERLLDQLVRNIQPKRRVGETLQGGWQLKQFLGMGAFGEVWVGENPLHPDRRAFKFFTDEGAKDWFEREGRALFAVQRDLGTCPNVIRYVDVALDAEPHPYLVLEYVGGGSLEDWLTTPDVERAKLDLADVVSGVARGLAAAHRHGIYHRDMKPANVLLTQGADPVPRIADFGLSRVEQESAAGSSYGGTQAVVVGTRMYLPPEAADPYEVRRPAQDDVFAFGVIWYQLLTGRMERPPYDFADRLLRVEADARSVRLVTRCLANPDRRYKDAPELLDDLETEAPPGPGEWEVPEGGVDVAPLAREYLDRLAR